MHRLSSATPAILVAEEGTQNSCFRWLYRGFVRLVRLFFAPSPTIRTGVTDMEPTLEVMVTHR